MILGGPVMKPYANPEEWTAALHGLGFRAAYCPVDEKADEKTVKAFADAAARAGIVIAEVGAWSNPISPVESERREALRNCRDKLALAERIGAKCCVNVPGSRGAECWYGAHPENFSGETFAMIVESVREIMDSVKPSRTYYTLEAMPWIPPYTADSYLKLLKAIDRPRCAVHFDPVNLLWSPERCYGSGAVIREFVAKLGPLIKSCHAKDILVADDLAVRLPEVRPGLGVTDYSVLLTELNKLDSGLPLMLEHLKTEEEYGLAADHIRKVARGLGIAL